MIKISTCNTCNISTVIAYLMREMYRDLVIAYLITVYSEVFTVGRGLACGVEGMSFMCQSCSNKSASHVVIDVSVM